jgi:glycosyltransferase involved in cell wall biosynthesis
MKLVCICPTFKRPYYLQNVIACFEAQTHTDAHLVICDDSQQIRSQTGHRWTLNSIRERQPSLAAKFNVLAAMATVHRPDALVVWEDDDVYLPGYLAAVNAAMIAGGEYVAPPQIDSTYDQEIGEVQREDSTGRFHASISYTVDLFNRVGGYPNPDDLELTFDQLMFRRLLDETGLAAPTPCEVGHYVYRWGNVGFPGVQLQYHGSSSGDAGFREHWDRLGAMQVSPVGTLHPGFDEETSLLYSRLAGVDVDVDRRVIVPIKTGA